MFANTTTSINRSLQSIHRALLKHIFLQWGNLLSYGFDTTLILPENSNGVSNLVSQMLLCFLLHIIGCATRDTTRKIMRIKVYIKFSPSLLVPGSSSWAFVQHAFCVVLSCATSSTCETESTWLVEEIGLTGLEGRIERRLGLRLVLVAQPRMLIYSLVEVFHQLL